MCPFWFLLFLVRALFGSCSFRFLPFLVHALFCSSSFLFVLFLICALFGSCPFWFVLFLVQQWKTNWERFGWFLTQKIDFESQILALFDTSPLHQFSKFNNFLSTFVPPTWKLNNLYYRNECIIAFITSFIAITQSVFLFKFSRFSKAKVS